MRLFGCGLVGGVGRTETVGVGLLRVKNGLLVVASAVGPAELVSVELDCHCGGGIGGGGSGVVELLLSVKLDSAHRGKV